MPKRSMLRDSLAMGACASVLAIAAVGCSLSENPKLVSGRPAPGSFTMSREQALATQARVASELMKELQSSHTTHPMAGRDHPPDKPIDVFEATEAARNAGLRRLTRVEIASSVQALTGRQIDLSQAILEDDKRTITNDVMKNVFSDAVRMESYVVAINGLVDSFDPAAAFGCTASGAAASCEAGISPFLRKAFRRDVTSEETTRYVNVYRAGVARSGVLHGLRSVLQEALMSPHFLYVVDPVGAERLARQRYAAKLSYFVTGAPPDEALLTALVEGTPDDAAIDASVDRLLSLPSAGHRLFDVVRHWLRLSEPTADLKPDHAADLGGNTLASMQEEVRLLAQDVLLRGGASLPDLVTANHTFVNQDVARLYGLNDVTGSQFRRVDLDPNGTRQGLFTTPLVLFSNSKESGRSPMQRGKFIVFNALCHFLPSSSIPLMSLPESVKSLPTLRERFVVLEKVQPCAACHTMLNAGFAFERFDPVGKEWPANVVAQSELSSFYKPPGIDEVTFDGSREAAQALAAMPDLTRCFTRRTFEFAVGREAGVGDDVTMRALHAQFEQAGFRWNALVRSIVKSPAFRGP